MSADAAACGEPDGRADADAALRDGQHLARGAMANAAVLVAANFRGVFTFLIARLLGQAALGQFSLMFATVDALSKVATLGFDQGIVPLVARRVAAGQRGAARAVFVRAIALGAAASCIVVAIAWPVLMLVHARGWSDAFAPGALLMLLALPGLAVARISTGASRGLMEMRAEFYSRGLGETWITIAVFVVAMLAGLRVGAPAVAVALGSLGGACIAFALARRAFRDAGAAAGAPEGGVPPAAALTRFALPLSGAALLNNLALRVDVLLLGAFVGRAPGVTLESFGVFCAAVEIAGGLRKVRQVFDPIFAPVAAMRRESGGHADLRATVAGPGRWVLAGQLPAVGVMALAAGPLLSIYGPGFSSGALWLVLLAVAHAANSFAGLVETLLMIERPALNLMNAAVTVLVQCAVGLWLVPVHGVLGAVIGMAAGFTVQGILRFAELKHVFGWTWPWRTLLRPLTAFVLAMTPALALRLILGDRVAIISAVVFAVAYLGAWAMLGADPEDRLIWRRLLKRQ